MGQKCFQCKRDKETQDCPINGCTKECPMNEYFILEKSVIRLIKKDGMIYQIQLSLPNNLKIKKTRTKFQKGSIQRLINKNLDTLKYLVI
jgi:hypothetical protein